eukprot:TRINITY_DN10_c0_g1_i1.p1 TRINITY_DN10_c0_g1~~TRINITY_DN10_c0_g1_i1.p1  ORF type:complete len:502 (+),score=146.63 TRINITY_DN10_c0_g1_i1:90-1508(+)
MAVHYDAAAMPQGAVASPGAGPALTSSPVPMPGTAPASAATPSPRYGLHPAAAASPYHHGGHRGMHGASQFTHGSQVSMPSLLSAPLSCSAQSRSSDGSSVGSQNSDFAEHWGHWRMPAAAAVPRPQTQPQPAPPAPPKRKDASGRTIVTTPWFPQGVAKSGLSLGDEVVALWRLLQLTTDEQAARQNARTALQDAAGAIWPGVTVKVYGSFAYGLSLPHSELDLVCEGCGDLGALGSLLERLEQGGYEVVGETREGAQALARIRSRSSGVVCSVSFVTGRSPARRSVQAIRKLLVQFPAVPAVFAVLRLVSQQSRCGDPADGGVPSYAVLVMILHACHGCERPNDPGQLLIEFCRLYGAAGTAAQEPLWVEDPITAENNVVAGCLKLPQARQVLHNCSLALSKWGRSKWDGYRGRSPLSGILAHGQLWARAEVKQAEARAAVPQAAVPAADGGLPSPPRQPPKATQAPVVP